ncbi:MAG: class II fructose-bisphosphatase [Firmicutes bacterium]|nr:class II fructose-bisphosphatase [Bacillota bacterium]
MKRGLCFELVRVTEAAALAVAPWRGKGEKEQADQAAVDAMRKALNSIDIKAEVVIGEGEKDKAPMLYIGEQIGCGLSPKLDIAVDPVEGTNLVANGYPNALSVIALAEEGRLLKAPDMYMKKIVVGKKGKGKIDLQSSPTQNIKNTANACGKAVSDITVVVLNRPRHQELIREIRETGARIKLIPDGDLAGGIAAALDGTGIDLLMGIGGAPEGVLTATAVKCLGGEMQAQLYPVHDYERQQAKKMGINDLSRVLMTDDLAGGSNLVFAATGITTGELLDGVMYNGSQVVTHSLIIENNNKIRKLASTHLNKGLDSCFCQKVINI